MASRPTITDIAKEANVSVATVDRVLNGRAKVNEATALKVFNAASKIGYHGVSLIKQRISEGMPQYRFGFLFQKPRHQFYQNFAREAEAAVQNLQGARGIANIEYWTAQDPNELAELLRQMGNRNQAVAMTAPDYPVLTAVVEELREKGVPVFSLLTDFASGAREGYIGLNNRKAGRTAAWMISKAAKKPGKVAIFVGSHRFHGHELREIGFRSYFREHAPEFQVLDTLVNLETRQITYEATIDLMHRHPELVGLYCAGGGMEGVIAALREERKQGELAVVVNELTTDSRAALADNLITMAICTPLASLCREIVSMMIQTIENGPAAAPGQTFLPLEIYVPENI